ncbi:MAG: regulatory protein GemA [Nitrospinae bacterium]|nr:regulatory protein GemA [Nitrospinota bacterium]
MPRKQALSKRLPNEPKPLTGSSSTVGPTRSELAKIHIAKRDLKLTDQLYRGVLNVLFGETSAKDLSHEQIDELLDHFKSLGWENEFTKNEEEPPSQSKGRGPATMAQLGLIMYLWKHGPGIRNKSTQALDYFLNHHFHVSNLKEVKANQVPGILGAIKKMGKV